jgi:hypothetical protein
MADRWQHGPFGQWRLLLILEQDLSVVCLLAAEAAFVDEVMMVPA